MKKEKIVIGNDPITDARKLGIPKMILLGIQHTFAMFGATVLVPLITGLDVATTLFMAGIGTLLFHIFTKFQVPAFLGSSFAFLGGYAAIAPFNGKDGLTQAELLPYACIGVACAGLVYLVLALFIKVVGVSRVMRYFPPVVTGPIIIAIGLGLAGTAVSSCKTNWILALVALAVIIIFNIWGKGMSKIIPIILGIGTSYILSLILYFIAKGNPDLIQTIPALFSSGANDAGVYQPLFNFGQLNTIVSNIADGKIWGNLIGFPIHFKSTIFAVDYSNTSLVISSIVAIIPISLATMMEHIGDISAISATCGKNFIANPGLNRSLAGDGIATSLSAVFGGPANTTYGENTGVLALTKVYDPKVVRIAAVFAVIISFFPIIAAIISTIPSFIIGGVSFVLYGMISAIGIRNVVENKVDFTKSRNLIVAAVILVSALGLGTSVAFSIGSLNIGLSALAVAAIAGILLNAILPGKDYTFTIEEHNPTGVDFQINSSDEEE